MILTVDIGNSHTVFGVYGEDGLRFSSRVKTDPLRTETEYAVLLSRLLDFHRCSAGSIEGAAVSSVVPALTPILRAAIGLLGPIRVLTVGPGVKTGLDIRIDNPGELASDLVCTAVGATERYPLPAVIIDLGTATKITVVDRNRRYIGGAIAPGVTVSLGALTRTASLLPAVALDAKIRPICGDTAGAVMSGVVLGTASMLDGMIDRFAEEIGKPDTIVACGGMAPTIIPHCRHAVILDETLPLFGLVSIYRKNC